MDIKPENIDKIYEMMPRVIIHIAPGIVIMDLIFKRGFLSGNIQNIYDFLLYIFWCLILSSPYHSYPNYSFKFFLEVIKHKSDIQIKNRIEIGFTLIQIFVTCIIFKLLDYYNIPSYEIMGISILYLKFIFTYILVLLISYYFPKPFIIVFKKIYEPVLFDNHPKAERLKKQYQLMMTKEEKK